MKTVRITGDHCHMIAGVHYSAEDGPISVPDEVANQLLRLKHAELVTGPNQSRLAPANPLADAVSPLVPEADPLHAARQLGSKIEENPGLVAIAESGNGSAKKVGRVKGGDDLHAHVEAQKAAVEEAARAKPDLVPADPATANLPATTTPKSPPKA